MYIFNIQRNIKYVSVQLWLNICLTTLFNKKSPLMYNFKQIWLNVNRIAFCTFGFLWWLIWYAFVLAPTGQSAKRHVVLLSSCRPVVNDVRQTACCRAACCHDVTLSLGSIEELAYKPSDRTTLRQRATRQSAVWFDSLEIGRQGDNTTYGALSCCR
jgi:hypothetical protein